MGKVSQFLLNYHMDRETNNKQGSLKLKKTAFLSELTWREMKRMFLLWFNIWDHSPEQTESFLREINSIIFSMKTYKDIDMLENRFIGSKQRDFSWKFGLKVLEIQRFVYWEDIFQSSRMLKWNKIMMTRLEFSTILHYKKGDSEPVSIFWPFKKWDYSLEF